MLFYLGVKLCPVILMDGDPNKEEILLQKIILPWMKKYDCNELPKEICESFSATSQNDILHSLLENSSKPDWTITTALKNLDLKVTFSPKIVV